MLDAAANRGFAPAQLLLGECYQAGTNGYPKRAERAVEQFEAAAQHGNAYAIVKFAECLYTGHGIRRDREDAAVWLKKVLSPDADFSLPERPRLQTESAVDSTISMEVARVAAADPVANTRAEAHYLLGKIVATKQPIEAQAHFVAAATAGPSGRDGIREAAVEAALRYAFGRGVPRDPENAKRMLDQSSKLARRAGVWMVHAFTAAKLVDEFAVSQMEDEVAESADEMTADMQLDIARQFTNRKSKDYNPAEAVKWFELAANNGQAWAMLELAFLYSRGDLGHPDREAAYRWFERAGDGDPPKHVLGLANLVVCLCNGIGVAANPEKAATRAKAFRDLDIVCYLATIGECPKDTMTYDEVLALNRVRAKEGNDAQAQYLLAQRYLNGWGVKLNRVEAEKWLKRSVGQHNGVACRELGHLYERYPGEFGLSRAEGARRAEDLYRQGADAGDVAAICELARVSFLGRNGIRDLPQSERLCKRALQIDPSCSQALNTLGRVYELYGNFPEAAERFAAADRLNNRAASNNLGRLYYAGRLGGRDFKTAYHYFERAAEKGDSDAQLRIAYMLEHGQGVSASITESAYYLRLSALGGELAAMQRLVDYYFNGKGGAQDLDRALFWLERSYEAGDRGALTTIADILLRKRRFPEALKILEPMADSILPGTAAFALERLSRCYRDGNGTPQDLRKAQQLLVKAAELGNGDALLRMADLAIDGGRDAEGIDLLERSAAAGTAAADFRLGQMCYFGRHLPRDLNRALRHFRDAAKGLDPEALCFLAEMTVNRMEGAPTLDDAIRFARYAEGVGNPRATAVADILEKRKVDEQAAPTETTEARPS